MGRRADPEAPYRVMRHKANGYAYAATCETVARKNGTKYRKYTHLGVLEEGNRFVPGLRYLCLEPSERERLVFPDGWDLSALEGLGDNLGSDLADPEDFENKLYGSMWLLLKVAEQRGVTDDLAAALGGSAELANDVLTIATYPYLTGASLSRLARWQRSNKVPSAHDLTPSRITRLCQAITHDQVMEFFRLRINRQAEDAYFACDSTTRSAWGDHIAEISYGRNKDNRDMDCTLEVVVYSLTAHEPVYYRAFPGNMPDARTVRTIAKDLSELGIGSGFTVYDRGYESSENIGAFLAADLPFLVCAKVAQAPALPAVSSVEFDGDGFPTNMDYDEGEGLFHAQVPLAAAEWEDSDGKVAKAADGDLVCDVYLDMRERVTDIARLRSAMAEEKKRLEGMDEAEMLGKRSSVNKGLRYHRVSFEGDGGGEWSVAGWGEVPEKVAKAKATCGFFTSVSYRVPGGAMEHLRIYRTRDEQEKYFEQMKDQMGFHTQDCSSDASKAGRMFAMFVGLILSSVVRATWSSSRELRREFPTTLDMVDEMRDVRWCGYPDGTTHMTSFLSKQVKVCEEFGIDVPTECLPRTERQKARRKSGKDIARREGPARNKVDEG